MNAAWARVDVYSRFIIKNTPQRRTVWEITFPSVHYQFETLFSVHFTRLQVFFWLYNDLQISAVFVLTKWHYWSRRPGKSFLPVQNPCPCCRSWGIHPSPDLHPEGPCVHCQSGKSHTVHSICWVAPCCHTRRWYCYSTALASAACPDWWWRKSKKTIVQWVFSRSINCTPGCILLVFLAKKKRWVSKWTDLISSFLSDYWTLHLR